jgi:hypothetical protein
MAIPTITVVTPARIYTGGSLITITGTGFQTRYPVDPSTPHPWPDPLPTVQVLIDGVPARKVVVSSSTSLSCLPTSHDPTAASVTVKNLDVTGAPISGETVTRAGLLTFARVDLAIKADMLTVIEALVTELRRQVIANVSLATSVDFDGDPSVTVFAGVDRANLPALCLSGPTPTRDRAYNTTPRFETLENDGLYSRRITAETQDLVFQLLGLDHHTARVQNLHALVTQFFKDNIYLIVPRDPANLALGTVQYELESTPFSSTSTNNNNDIRSFVGTVTIRGYQFEDVAGFPTQSVLERSSEVSDIEVVSNKFVPPPILFDDT